jgi:hypothetical protein
MRDQIKPGAWVSLMGVLVLAAECPAGALIDLCPSDGLPTGQATTTWDYLAVIGLVTVIWLGWKLLREIASSFREIRAVRARARDRRAGELTDRRKVG